MVNRTVRLKTTLLTTDRFYDIIYIEGKTERSFAVDRYMYWLGQEVGLFYNGEPVEDAEVTGALTGLKVESQPDGSNVWHWARIGDTWYPLGILFLMVTD